MFDRLRHSHFHRYGTISTSYSFWNIVMYELCGVTRTMKRFCNSYSGNCGSSISYLTKGNDANEHQNYRHSSEPTTSIFTIQRKRICRMINAKRVDDLE